MSERTYATYIALIGAVCGYVVINRFVSADSLTLRNSQIQGFFVGYGLALVTIEIIARKNIARINGWVTAFGCGLPGNGMFTRAAHVRIFPGPINVPQEAMYWRTRVDGAGDTLSGAHDYIMHFPPEGLPPNDAFWSLTMADAKERFVANPLNRYLVGKVGNDWREPRYAPYGRRVRPQVWTTSPACARDGRSLLQRKFTAPNNTIVADVGTRTTGTHVGDYLIAGPGWKGQVPSGMKQISSPNNSVFVIGRILVYGDSDLPTAYALTKQIQIPRKSHRCLDGAARRRRSGAC